MIIFLNGNSSSGKSEIARAIMHQSERPFLYYSIDHLVNFWIDEKFVAFEDEPKAWFFQQHVTPIIDTQPLFVEGPHVDQLRWDMIEAFTVLIKKGYDLIIDEVLWKKEIFEHYAKALTCAKTVYLVKIFCELLESERRETTRSDRYLGIARSLYEQVYTEPPSYDMEIDSTFTPIEACAQNILDSVNKIPTPTAFLNFLKNAISFKALTQEDFVLMHEWLNASHVNKWWGENKPWSLGEVEKKYESYVLGYKEEQGQQKSIYGFIICCAENPIGYIQFYNAYDFSREGYHLENLPSSLAAIDLFIGEPSYLNKGLGVASILNFLEKVVFRYFDYCFVDPAAENKQAIQAYQKAGFKVVQHLTQPHVLLMIKKKD